MRRQAASAWRLATEAPRRPRWARRCYWRVLAAPCLAQFRLETEAYNGSPFGVGRVTLRFGGDFRLQRPILRGQGGGGRIADLARRIASQAGGGTQIDLDGAQIMVVERANRVFYPVFERRDRPILREFIAAAPTDTTVLFLFQGDAPLDLSVQMPGAAAVNAGQVVPRTDAAGFDRLARAWWLDYGAAASQGGRGREYPPIVEEYLADTLLRRMQLKAEHRRASATRICWPAS